MLGRHVPGRTSAVGRWGAGGNADGVGDVAWQELPDFVRDHKAKSTRDVVVGTLVSRLGLDILEPRLELSSRGVIGEGVVKGDGYRHDGWMNGWMWQDSNRNC
jgi:hypothetical protein